MKPHRISMFVGALLLASITTVSTAFADVERRFETGTCGDGSAWWTLTHYENGIPVLIEGVDCKGKPFALYPMQGYVTIDPGVGLIPTHTGHCGGAGGAATWFSIIRYNMDHRPQWMAGRDCTGNYWLATSFEGAEVGGQLD